MLSIVDLGIVHRVDADAEGGPIRVEILPTFVGCPALELIKHPIAERLAAFGRPVEVEATFEIPWTVERIIAGRARRPARGRHRHRRARPAASASGGLDRPRAARPLPALRLAADVAREPVRADAVPDDPLLRRLPPAVRSDQAGLTDEPAGSGEVRPAIVGVVGAGTMGAGIAQVALEAGCEVALFDVDSRRHRACGASASATGSTRARPSSDLDPDRGPTPG